MTARSCTGGSIPAARDHMLAVFGRAPSRSSAAKIDKAWRETVVKRRAAGIRRLRAIDLPPWRPSRVLPW